MRKRKPDDKFIEAKKGQYKVYLVKPKEELVDVSDLEFTFDGETIYQIGNDYEGYYGSKTNTMTADQIKIFEFVCPEIVKGLWKI